MKLYFSKGACSLAVRILVNELNLPCEFEAVDLKTKKTASGKDFLKISPKGAVPVLELNDGNILTENGAIQQYLADQYHDKAPNLLPEIKDFNRYKVVEWQSFIGSDLHKTFGPLFNPEFPSETKDKFKEILKRKLAVVNEHLNQKEYLVNEQFTVVDGYIFVMLRWLHHFNIEISTWPNLAKYFDKLKKRPSIEKALKEEALS